MGKKASGVNGSLIDRMDRCMLKCFGARKDNVIEKQIYGNILDETSTLDRSKNHD